MQQQQQPIFRLGGGALFSIGRFRFVWAVENTFDPSWSGAKPASMEDKMHRQPNADTNKNDSGSIVDMTGGGGVESTARRGAASVVVGTLSLGMPSFPPNQQQHMNEGPVELSISPAPGQTRPYTTVSLEYILLVTFALCVIFSGASSLCQLSLNYIGHLGFPTIVQLPRQPFAWLLGAVGRDGGADIQWKAYEFFCPVLALLAWIMGRLTCHIHRCQSEARASAGERVSAGTTRVPAPPSGNTEPSPPSQPLGSNNNNNAGGAAAGSPRGRLSAFVFSLCCRRQAMESGYAIIGILFITLAHNTHVVFPLVIVTCNYLVFTALQRWRRCPYWLFMLLMWATHVGVMCANEYFQGYEYFYWVQRLLPTMEGSALLFGVEYKPLIPRLMRWHITYRMFVLRMISFNYDMWEANRNAGAARERALQKHLLTCIDCAKLRERKEKQSPVRPGEVLRPWPRNNSVSEDSALLDGSDKSLGVVHVATVGTNGAGSESDAAYLKSGGGKLHQHVGRRESGWCYKLRMDYPREPCEYNYVRYIAYLLFPPVYIAGPISSFNAFVSHMHSPSLAMPRRDKYLYALRIVFTYFVMQCLQHTIYLTAFTVSPHLLWQMAVGDQALFLYFYLAYLYLKFNFIWKTSRLFATWSGIEVPENLLHCFSNACFTRDFWRSWHASFNLWIVRYMYIPMGGRKRMLFSVFPIFFFIAIWHDHALHLLMWAALIIATFVLEVVVGSWYGKLSSAFSREMDRVKGGSGGGSREKNDSRSTNINLSAPPAGAAVGVSDSDGVATAAVGGEHGVRTGLWASAAYFAVTRTSPTQRAYLQRVLTACGGAVAVGAQITANIVGYCVRRDVPDALLVEEETAGGGSESTTTKMLHLARENAQVCVIAACFLYTIASLGTLSKAKAAVLEREAKKRYGLQE